MNSNVKALLFIVIGTTMLFTSCQAATEETYCSYHTFDANNTALAALPKGTNQAVFIGSSGISFWESKFSFNPGRPYINRGVIGQNIGQMLLRFRHDVLDLKPTYAVVLGGNNNIIGGDTNQYIFETLKSIAEVSNANDVIPVLCGLTPVCDTWAVSEPLDKILELNGMMETYCNTTGKCLYADFYTPLIDTTTGLLRSDLSLDCKHPNGDGYNLLNVAIQGVLDADIETRSKSGSFMTISSIFLLLSLVLYSMF